MTLYRICWQSMLTGTTGYGEWTTNGLLVRNVLRDATDQAHVTNQPIKYWMESKEAEAEVRRGTR